MLHEPGKCLDHVSAMLKAGGVVTRSGKILPTPIHSICVHGDSPGAVAIARALRDQLKTRFTLGALPIVMA